MTVLFVIATVLLFLTIDWLVQRSKSEKATAAAAPKPVRELAVRLPDGIFFAPSHTWLNLFPSGRVRLGVDDFIAGLLEHPQVLLLKHAGEMVRKGEALIELKSDGHRLTVRAPMDGEVVSVNDELPRNPGLLGEGLFSDGWAYTLRPARNSDLKGLLIGGETRVWIRNEFQRLKDLLTSPPGGAARPAFMQEGGPPISGVLNTLDEDTWRRLDEEFLKVQ